MRHLISINLALLACLWGAGAAVAASGHWDVQLVGSGGGDTIYVKVSPVVQMDDLCTFPSGFCGGVSSVSLLVSPCPIGKPCSAFDSYQEGFRGGCGVPCYQEGCLGGSHTLTLLRGVSYTFRGELHESWMERDPGTGRCTEPCEHLVPFSPVTYLEASEPPTQPSIRLSWDNCSPLVVDKSFTIPAVERLVLSASNVSGTYSAHDHTLRVGPQVPDAWRFDDGGCQGPPYLSFSTTGLTKTCPAFQGAAPLAITGYLYDPESGDASIRLVNTFNDFVADPSTRYTLWVINVDHTYSVAGPGAPGSTCGDAERSLNLDVVGSEFLLSSGGLVHPLPGETHVTWNGGVQIRVDAGNDTTVTCSPVDGGGTLVQLDGSRSDIAGLHFLWSAPGVSFDDCSSVRPIGLFPAGVNEVVLTVSNEALSVRDTVLVTIEDSEPPALTVKLTPRTLWPPNHELATIHAEVKASDSCDPRPAIKLVSITSSDPDRTDTPKDEAGDIQGAAFGTADFEFQLRSERIGEGAGRDYTVCYEATDGSANRTRVCRVVAVPHDRGGRGAVEISGQTWYLVVFGAPDMSVRSIEPSSVSLGTADFLCTTWSGVAPTYQDSDGDEIEDARFPLAETQGSLAGHDLSAGLFARWEAGGTGYQAIIPLAEIVGVPGTPAVGGRLVAYARPNPGQGGSVIHYSLPARGLVSLNVYDISGRLVAHLVDEVQDAGLHQARFQMATHGAGSQVLLYRLRWGETSVTGRLLVFR